MYVDILIMRINAQTKFFSRKNKSGGMRCDFNYLMPFLEITLVGVVIEKGVSSY